MHYIFGILILLALISWGVSWLWNKFIEYAKTNPIVEFIVSIPPELFILGTILFVSLSLFFFILHKVYKAEKTQPLPTPVPEAPIPVPSKTLLYKRKDCGSCRPMTRHEEHLISIVREELKPKTELMNGEERDLYWMIIRALKPFGCFIVSPQVALRAFIKTPESGDSWRSLGGKHVDFLISERKTSRPLLVVEYHGGLHYGESDITRRRVEKSDEIKRILLKQIDLPLVIIPALGEGEKFEETKIFQQIYPSLNVDMDR